MQNSDFVQNKKKTHSGAQFSTRSKNMIELFVFSAVFFLWVVAVCAYVYDWGFVGGRGGGGYPHEPTQLILTV